MSVMLKAIYSIHIIIRDTSNWSCEVIFSNIWHGKLWPIALYPYTIHYNIYIPFDPDCPVIPCGPCGPGSPGDPVQLVGLVN